MMPARMNNTRSRSQHAATVLLLAAGTIAAGALVGCGEADELAGVQRGRDGMVRLSSSAPDLTRESAYSKVQSEASAVDADGAGGAAAQLIRNVSGAGLAQLELSAAADIARDAGDQIRLLNSIVRAHSHAVATLDELQRFDVNRNVDEIDARLSQHRGTLAALQSSEGEIESRLDQARGQIARMKQDSDALRAQESTLRDSAMRADPIERAPIIKDANVIRRQADSVDRSVDLKQLDADQIERDLADVRSDIESAERLIEINEQSRNTMQSKSQELARAAQDARARLSEIATQAQAVADELSGFLNGSFAPAIEGAIRSYGGASRAGSRSDAIARSTGAGAQTIVHRGLGQSHLLSAIVYSSAAEIAARLDAAGISTALDTNALKELADQSRNEAGNSLESYASAASSAASSGGNYDSSISAIEALAMSLRGIEPEDPADDSSTDQFEQDGQVESSDEVNDFEDDAVDEGQSQSDFQDQPSEDEPTK